LLWPLFNKPGNNPIAGLFHYPYLISYFLPFFGKNVLALALHRLGIENWHCSDLRILREKPTPAPHCDIRNAGCHYIILHSGFAGITDIGDHSRATNHRAGTI